MPRIIGSILLEAKLMLLFKYHQEWTDINMKWNKSEYGNVEDIRIPPHKLWKPDVLMYNR